jgi:hypothetical protein
MPEHVSIEYQHPGKCPLCAMTLVPVSAEALAKMQPGGKVEYYTCPMPEHSDVKLDKPGKCPKCDMTLIPVMPKPAPPADPHAEHSAAAPVPSPLYTCPMEEHADVVSDQPGQCPKCEMKLVETSQVKHAKQAEEHWRKQHPAPPADSPPQAAVPSQLYTCGMPEHADMASDKPGQCPKCGMKLAETSKVDHGKKAEAQWRKDHGQPPAEKPTLTNTQIYSCPMHPQVNQPHPGNCPICVMKLVPINRPDAGGQPTESKPGAALPTLYTCPMASHAHIVSEGPGKCSACEMDLVETSKVAHGLVADENWRKQHPAPAPAPQHQH